MNFFMFWIGFASIIGFVTFMAYWSTHIYMNKGENLPYDWCGFKTFIKEFNKYKNHPELKINNTSILLYDKREYKSIVYLHADIIKFDDRCMILYPLSYMLYHIWKYNVIKTKGNRQKGLWK